MSPYQTARMVRVFHKRGWRMPIATLLREFGTPDLLPKKRSDTYWVYVSDVFSLQEEHRPCTDWAFMIDIKARTAKFGGSVRLNSCFFAENPFRRIRWQKMLRPWKAA